MKLYKCDGAGYLENWECKKEEKDELPKDWITIEGRIITENKECRILQSYGTLHFCSKECLKNYLFKDFPDYNELRIYFNIFTSATSLKDEFEIKKAFKDYCEEHLCGYRYYKEDLKTLLS